MKAGRSASVETDDDERARSAASKMSVAPVVNDALAHLGISLNTFRAEMSALLPGERWSTNGRALKYDISMIAWTQGGEVLADVIFSGGHKLDARTGFSVLRLEHSLPETLDTGLTGHRIGRVIGHPILSRPSFVIEKVLIPPHGAARLVYFHSPGESLAAEAEDSGPADPKQMEGP